MQVVVKNISHEERIGKESKKPFTSCKLTVYSEKEQRDIFISGFGSSNTKTWEAGDTVDIDVEQNNLGYWNFKENQNTKPSPDKKLALLISIDSKLDRLLSFQNVSTVTLDEIKF